MTPEDRAETLAYDITRAIRAAVAAEREACAQIADTTARDGYFTGLEVVHDYEHGPGAARSIAAAIRARE